MSMLNKDHALISNLAEFQFQEGIQTSDHKIMILKENVRNWVRKIKKLGKNSLLVHSFIGV